MQNCPLPNDGLLIGADSRPFVLTRASYAGGHRYAATWTGDNSSTWNHLRLTTPMLLNLGLSGFALSGADVGGFAAPRNLLLTRWIQLATFQPSIATILKKVLGSGAVGTRQAQEGIRRATSKNAIAYALSLHTTEEMTRTVCPLCGRCSWNFLTLLRMGVHSTSTRRTVSLWPDLMVSPAPYPDGLKPYEVQFAAGDWYDYWSGAKVASGAALNKIVVQPVLETLPVYVRKGRSSPCSR